MDIIKKLCEEFKIKSIQAENTVKLIDEGNTIPFIARYRKEQTGSLDDVILRNLSERLVYLRNIEERKQEVIRLIDEQGKLTEELRDRIFSAEVLQKVEDLYRPYKKKKSTKASLAKEKGLEPFAEEILKQEITLIEKEAQKYLSEEHELSEINQVIQGAKDIIAEYISDNAEFREKIRNIYVSEGEIVSDSREPETESVYEMYYKYREKVSKIPGHRILAVNRGEKEGILKVSLQVPEEKIISLIISEMITSDNQDTGKIIKEASEDSYKRLIAPSVEREVRNILTENAEEEAIKVFAENTRNLLLTSPVSGYNVLAIDPSFRTGCKIAAVDETGKLLGYTTVYPNEPRNEIEKSKKKLLEFIDKYNVDIIAIGNGTASRETEKFVSDSISGLDRKIAYTIVSEAGASVYSASKIGAEEYPDLDVTIRGAVSIGKRLQDPLAELVKIDPKSIGVGQYQHDVNQKKLNTSLDGVVEDCVNSVGVDLNTASVSLLEYISGINSSIAKNIVKFRDEKGRFKSRNQIKDVSRLGEKAFEQCAGFLRISQGINPLDMTAVHPESYEAAEKLIKKLGYSLEDLRSGSLKDIEDRILEMKLYSEAKPALEEKISVKSFEDLSKLIKQPEKKNSAKEMKNRLQYLAKELEIGVPTLSDIINELKKPGRDPREDMPKPIFRTDILKMEDLKEGMQVTGTVRNVVDFGAFVDIGLKQDGLVHISELSDKYVKSAMDAVQVGDVVSVTVLDVDKHRNRIALSMKKTKEKR